MGDKRPVIVIGAPCYGSVAPEILEDWMRFAFHCGRRLPQFDFHLAIKTKSEQFRARNAIVDAAQQENADYLLMIDDDMIINIAKTQGPTDGYGFLDRMIAHDVDICGILYYQRTGECKAVLMNAVGSGGYRFLRDDEIEYDLQKVDVAGGGCLLIKMRVFDKILHPYFEPEFQFGTDIQLCRKATSAGFHVWADTSIEFGHVREERVVVTSKNRHQFQVDVIPGEIRRFIAASVYDDLVDDAEKWTGFTRDQFSVEGQYFHSYIGKSNDLSSDVNMYLRFPKERVARQVWFNTEVEYKRRVTEFILSTVDIREKRDILDFGCGIGIPAFTFAKQGHRVTATDLEGTGTYEFLRWRAKQHDVNIKFQPSLGGELPDYADESFDVIVATDCLEHMKDWPKVLGVLSGKLRPGGVLFANNATFDDKDHPEHYDCEPQAFVAACAALGLLPINQIAYAKKSSRAEAAA